jgi:hypothetical protein
MLFAKERRTMKISKGASLALGAVMISILAFVSPAANAAIVDHSDYVTDTATNLDWLKFSSTVGLSRNQAASIFGAQGWEIASGAQVQSFESNFGWLADTPFEGTTANAGITDRMGSVIGYTYVTSGQRAILGYISDEWGGVGTAWNTLSDHYDNGFRNDYNAIYADQVTADFVQSERGSWMQR